MILNIQIDLVFGLYAKEDWTGIIEIDSSSTLEDLHYAIHSVFKFLILDFIECRKIRPCSHNHYHVTPDAVNGNTLIYLSSLQSS